jgi:predicted DNA-binding protein (MmcQ/YjbR family)
LRERYACVLPGWHMSKKHWNTVLLNNELNTNELQELIVHSYELVVSSLPKKLQHELSVG